MLDRDTALQRARHLLTLHRIEEARAVLHDVLADDSTSGPALRLLAELELEADEPQRAREFAELAVSHDSVSSSFHMLANTERRLGDFAAAVSSCERGLAIDPDDPGLHVTLSLAWAGPWLKDSAGGSEQERGRAFEAATRSAARALDLDPERPNAYYAAAVAHLIAGDSYGASQALDPGLALAPDWAEGHLLMSAIRARQGMAKLSSRHLAIAGRLNPRNETPIGILRSMGRGSRLRRRPQNAPWWLAPEARDVLEADRRLGAAR